MNVSQRTKNVKVIKCYLCFSVRNCSLKTFDKILVIPVLTFSQANFSQMISLPFFSSITTSDCALEKTVLTIARIQFCSPDR